MNVGHLIDGNVNGLDFQRSQSGISDQLACKVDLEATLRIGIRGGREGEIIISVREARQFGDDQSRRPPLQDGS